MSTKRQTAMARRKKARIPAARRRPPAPPPARVLLKRSVIEAAVARAKEVFGHFGVRLPEWGYWSAAQWQTAGRDYDAIRDCRLGWDVTDFGSGNFASIGRTLFTVRNGRTDDPRYPRSYAEKLILDPENQRAPAHFHRSKREDIICRFGGSLLVQLTAATQDGKPSQRPLIAMVDGRAVGVPPGGVVRLLPGMSITIEPCVIHQFWGEAGTGMQIDGIGYTVSGEISSVCDDAHDNVFLAPAERFPAIEEDVARQVYLCHEYPPARGRGSERWSRVDG